MRIQRAERMNFFTNFINKVKEKKAELDDRREFLKMVDKEAKPIRRLNYMKQMMKEAINEGVQKAKTDAKARVPNKKTTPQDFGFAEGLANPYKFLDQAKITTPKTNLTKKKKKRK